MTKPKVLRIVPPNIQGMMCGVWYLDIHNDNTVDIWYSDYTKESAKIDLPFLHGLKTDYSSDDFSLFAIVGAVQDKRQELK